MRLNLSKSHTIKGGSKPIQARSHKTTVNNTIFRIVTKGLYIRPIEAIVREISTNALDGHIAVGKADVPFEVTLPTSVSPYFIVRDFGCSMDNDTVFNVYGVLGESTKNATSDSIGGWGVGGKSPAAYTDTFFIHTYKDGMRRIYQSSCLQDSTPLELLLEGHTTEPDGVEVKVPVRSADIHRFQEAASSQLAAFDVKPIIKNLNWLNNFNYNYDLATAPSFNIERTLLVPDDEGNLTNKTLNIKIFESLLSDSLAVRMGCVVYPINTKSSYYEEYKKTLDGISKISGIKSLLVDLPVDTVDIKPSREDLDYTERTNDVLNIVMFKLLKHYRKEAITIAFASRHMPYAEAAEYIQEKSKNAGMLTYICNRYSNKRPFDDSKGTYADTCSKFNSSLRMALDNAATDNIALRKFSVFEDDKVRQFQNAGVSFRFNKDSELNIILKTNGYIKKLEYWINEDVDVVPSGLNSTKSNDRYYYHSSEIPRAPYTLVKKEDNAYLCLTQLQVDTFLEVFKKYFDVVNVLTMEPVPKAVRDTYASYSEYTSEKQIELSFNKTGRLSNSRMYSGTHSIRTINEIIATYAQEKPIYFYHNSACMGQERKLEQLATFLDVDICGISIPTSLANKVINKGLIRSFEALLDFLLESISKTERLKLVDNWCEAKTIDYIFSYSRSDGLTETLLSRRHYANVVPYFFKFLPKERPIAEFESIVKHFISRRQERLIKINGEFLLKRINKRTLLMVTRKETLSLLSSYSSSSVVTQLLQLNFKGFNPNANTKTD